jgi:hypothetical protein
MASTAYVYVVSNLIEFGENNRFAVDIGPLPIVAAVAVGMFVREEWRSHSGYECATAPITTQFEISGDSHDE